MKLLPGPATPGGDLTPYQEYPSALDSNGSRAQGGNQIEENKPVQIGRMVRKYWPLLPIFLLLGAAGGVTSVVLSPPHYKAKLVMEVGGLDSSFGKNGFDYSVSEGNEVNIQTQISILQSDTLRSRGAERVQQDVVAPPIGRDIFSRLRQRISPSTQDPIESAKRGLNVAIATFSAQPVSKTRLIQLTCESTNPDIAAQYLNSMAAEFQEDNSRLRLQATQKATEWLAGSIEDTKSKMQEAEERLREFSQASGYLFTGQQNQDNTLNDTKLIQLKNELARIQTERIAKQTRYEETLKASSDALPEILGDVGLLGYKQQIEVLNRDKAALETKFTPKHEKVREVDARLSVIEKAYQSALANARAKVKSDYEAALQQERLLSSGYVKQAQQVGSEAAKTAQYNSQKREVDTLHQVYQSLLMQQSEAGVSSSVPTNPIRVVEASMPPQFPYKPKPVMNISFGSLLGLVAAVALALIKEVTDKSISSPGISRQLLHTRELGVIPRLGTNGYSSTGRPALPSSDVSILNGEESLGAMLTWQTGPSFITESFRGTLASILRNQQTGREQKSILITSPGPSEGKTTVIQNLGIALAETGRRVLLVDADFRRPHLHRKFGLPNDWGIIDVLSEDQPLSSYPAERLGMETGFPGLSLLPNGAGLGQPNISKRLYSPRLREILETLGERYDMVLVDAPPILHVADARILAPLTDALILVLRCGVTDRASAMEAYQRIQDDGLTLLGTILTDYDLGSDRKHQYYYDYGETNRT